MKIWAAVILIESWRALNCSKWEEIQEGKDLEKKAENFEQKKPIAKYIQLEDKKSDWKRSQITRAVLLTNKGALGSRTIWLKCLGGIITGLNIQKGYLELWV